MKTFKLSALALGALALSIVAPVLGGEANEASKLKMRADKFGYTRFIINLQAKANANKWKPITDEDVTYLADLFATKFYPQIIPSSTEDEWTRWFKNLLQYEVFKDLKAQFDRVVDVSNIIADIQAAKKAGKITAAQAEEFEKAVSKSVTPEFAIKLPSGATFEPVSPSKSITSSGTERNEPYTLEELDAMLAKSKTPEGREELEDTPSLFSQLNVASKSPNRDIVARAKNILNNLNNNQEELPTLPLIEDEETTSQEAIAIPSVISSTWLARSASAVGRNMRSINAIAADKDKVSQLKELARGGDKNAKIILDAVAKHHKI